MQWICDCLSVNESVSEYESASARPLPLGSLRNDDGDGYENVTEKVNLRCLKLYRAYSISFNSSNVGKFFRSWILKDCIQFQEISRKLSSFVPVLDKREIRQFHVVVLQRRQRNVQKSVMHVQSCCFACLNLLLFCRSRCFGSWQPPLRLCSYYTRYLFVPMWKAIRGILFANLRLRGRLGRDGCQSALWDCFGERIFKMTANSSPKQSHNAPSRPDLPPNLKVANEWRWHRTGTSCSHTSNIVREWLPGGFGALILVLTSEYLLSSLFAFRHRFYSFTSATVQSYPHFDSDVNQ